MKLNLGSGNDYKKGWINVDISNDYNPDIIANLEEKLPFKTNNIKEIYASHIIEHLHNRIKFLEEIYRVCKNGAKITILTPYMNSIRALDHKAFFDETTFKCLDYRFRKNIKKKGEKFKIKFKLISINITCQNKIYHHIFHLFPFWIWHQYMSPMANELQVVYEVIK